MLSVRGLIFMVIDFIATKQQRVAGQCNGTATYHIASSLQPAVITSAGFYNNSNIEKCQWLIRAPLGQKIVIYFTSFDLQACQSCSCDNVTIFDGSYPGKPRLASYCDSALPAPVYSSRNEVLIISRSDAYGSFGGFQLKYLALSESSGCPLIDPKTSVGIIYSPGFPWKYSDNVQCNWSITVPKGQRISLKFIELRLERSRSCYDSLKVLDESSGILKEECCGTKSDISSYVYTYSRSIRIRFSSGHSNYVDMYGFLAFYQTHNLSVTVNPYVTTPGRPSNGYKCKPRNLFIKQSFAASPRWIGICFQDPPVAPNTTCTWHISTEEGNTLELTFYPIQIGHSGCTAVKSGCHRGHIKVWDGRTSDDPLIDTFCNINHPGKKPVKTTGNHMFIEFYSSSENDCFEASIISRKGTFRLVFDIVWPIALVIVLLVITCVVIKWIKRRRSIRHPLPRITQSVPPIA